MNEKKWCPCICTAIMGVLVIVFAWWQVPWGRIALTILGALVILKGIINKCCCEKFTSCCGSSGHGSGETGGCY